MAVQRHLRHLARSMAAKTYRDEDGRRWIAQKINKRGQKVSSVRVRVIRRVHTVAYEAVSESTGEVRDFVFKKKIKRYVVGYYEGGSGFLSVNDGRVTADGIARILGGRPAGCKSSYLLMA